MTRGIVVRTLMTAVAAAVVLTGCATASGRSGHGGEQGGPATGAAVSPSATATAATAAPSASGSSSASPSGSGSASPSPSGTASDPADPYGLGHKVIKYGDKSPHVKALQRRLKALHYDPGTVDGSYGPNTQFAVWAFKKINDLAVSSAVGTKTRTALADPADPKALKPKGGDDRVEINLTKQYLVVYEKGEVALISHISSGSGAHYCETYTDEATGEPGTACGVALTPTGNFKTYRRISGWRHSQLGYLYNPVYFNGGIAVHGEPAVPDYPASHGCVRIPMHTSTIFPKLVGDGVPVYVRKP